MRWKKVNSVIPAGAEPARLEFENVSAGYDGKDILQDVSFQVRHGARVAVVGPNGAGKSTLFKAMVGLLPIRSGRVLIHGMPLGSHQDCVGYVPQREDVDWQFPVTVQDVVMMGRFGRQRWWQRPTYQDQEIVSRCLDQMGLITLANRPIGELSGGQQQRVFLARSLAQEPHILLLDEPFTGVDISTQEATLHLLDRLQEQQVTVILSTHDLSLASQRFDEVILINHQLIAHGRPQEVFTPEILSRAFGGQLLMLPNGAVVVDDCCPAGGPMHLASVHHENQSEGGSPHA